MRFNALRETLLRGGIAPRHVRRYLRELDDHLADLTAAQQEAGHDGATAGLRARALLGNEEDLAAAMLAQPGLKSLPARLPWLVFGLLPPVAIAGLFLVTMVPLELTKRFHDMISAGALMAPAPLWFRGLAHAVALFANFVLGPGLAALMVWAAHRQRLDWKWPLLASVIIALTGFHMIARFPDLPVRGGQLSVGALQVLRLLGHYSPTPRWEMLAQFFLTLAPALWLLRRRHFFGRSTDIPE